MHLKTLILILTIASLPLQLANSQQLGPSLQEPISSAPFHSSPIYASPIYFPAYPEPTYSSPIHSSPIQLVPAQPKQDQEGAIPFRGRVVFNRYTGVIPKELKQEGLRIKGMLRPRNHPTTMMWGTPADFVEISLQ